MSPDPAAPTPAPIGAFDGKPRRAGTESFLASRWFELPSGTPDDATREGLAGKPAFLARVAAGQAGRDLP